jgi:hypothetical protein
MEFKHKIGQTVKMAINDSLSDVSVKITGCVENYQYEGEFIVIGDLPDMDAYVVFRYDESAYDAKIHTDDELAVFDFIYRAYGVSV